MSVILIFTIPGMVVGLFVLAFEFWRYRTKKQGLQNPWLIGALIVVLMIAGGGAFVALIRAHQALNTSGER
jgi:hypothetical protein